MKFKAILKRLFSRRIYTKASVVTSSGSVVKLDGVFHREEDLNATLDQLNKELGVTSFKVRKDFGLWHEVVYRPNATSQLLLPYKPLVPTMTKALFDSLYAKRCLYNEVSQSVNVSVVLSETDQVICDMAYGEYKDDPILFLQNNPNFDPKLEYHPS